MRDMGDLDAVHLGLDENEADIAEELQDFDDSFDTRSEASESGSESSDAAPSISSVSTAPSSTGGSVTKRKNKTKTKSKLATKTTQKRDSSPSDELNGKKKKKRGIEETKSKKNAVADTSNNSSENKRSTSEEPPKKLRKKALGTTVSNSNQSSNVASTANKSDGSDVEDEKPNLPDLDSDSESEDSDSGANHKRNGKRKAASKSKTPERNTGNGSDKRNLVKSYDYMTKLNYLFRDTRFFLIKSNNVENVGLSKTRNVWATLPQNDANLNQAFKEARNVLLIFSVNESGKFAGFARMSATSRRDIPQVAWVLPPSISSKALGGVIELDWICRKELSFNATLHLHNSWNEGKPVKIGRDGQEIEPKIGAELCRLFPEDEKVELTPILRKSKETAREMREKGIHVIYKPPRSLSLRGGTGSRGGGGGSNHFGPIRHKRSYGHSSSGPHHAHRSHHRPYMGGGGPPGAHYKRNSSPYRPGGGPVSRSGGGNGNGGNGVDNGIQNWDPRYMTSAQAAEMYVTEYMRTMHGQLPPLPFGFNHQVPLPGASGAGGALPPGAPASLYEQLPPPVRYYDGPGPPPLPDYPPPQPMRPPPPGFDKVPSYEDFANWKNAGLPSMPPPGFPGYGSSSSNNGAGNGGGAGGSNSGALGGNTLGGNGGGGLNSYRNRDSVNMNRARDRRDYQQRCGSARGNERDRHHFRAGGGDRGQRNYRDGRR